MGLDKRFTKLLNVRDDLKRLGEKRVNERTNSGYIHRDRWSEGRWGPLQVERLNG